MFGSEKANPYDKEAEVDIDFVKAQFQNVEHSSGAAPKLEDCLVVKRVGKGSMAAALKLAVGDLLMQVDGGAASKAQEAALLGIGPERRYVFCRPGTGATIHVRATGAALGGVFRADGRGCDRDVQPKVTRR